MSDGENKKFDLFIILYSLNIGGAEKIAASLKDLPDFNVKFVLFRNLVKLDKIYVDNSKITVLNKKDIKLRYYLPIYLLKLWLIKKRNKKAIFLSFLGLANLVNIITGGKTIISERFIQSFFPKFYKNDFYVNFEDMLIKIFYKKASRIIAVCEDSKKDLIENYRVDKNKIYVLPNFIDFEKAKMLYEKDNLSEDLKNHLKDSVVLCCVARMSVYKGLYELVYLFSKLSELYKDIKLLLVGDGEEKDRISSLCKEKNIRYLMVDENTKDFEAKVLFFGAKNNPYPYLKIADIFILNSFVEGFPNVVLEAMFAGCRIMVSRGSDVVEKLKENNPYFEVLPIFKMPDENFEIWLKTFEKVYMSIKTEGKKRIEYHNLQNYEKSRVLEQWNRFLLEQAR